MMNDHAWMQLHAHRESEHRARARRRGGDDPAAGRARPSPTRLLRVRLGRRSASVVASVVAAVRPAPAPTAAPTATITTAVTTAVPSVRAAGRRTASDAPTAAALAWMRLASGAGTLEPASPSAPELERDAA